jgi:hypothetical protein
MQLLTIQTPGIDITTNVTPTDDYMDEKGTYYEFVLYLG